MSKLYAVLGTGYKYNESDLNATVVDVERGSLIPDSHLEVRLVNVTEYYSLFHKKGEQSVEIQKFVPATSGNFVGSSVKKTVPYRGIVKRILRKQQRNSSLLSFLTRSETIDNQGHKVTSKTIRREFVHVPEMEKLLDFNPNK